MRQMAYQLRQITMQTKTIADAIIGKPIKAKRQKQENNSKAWIKDRNRKADAGQVRYFKPIIQASKDSIVVVSVHSVPNHE